MDFLPLATDLLWIVFEPFRSSKARRRAGCEFMDHCQSVMGTVGLNMSPHHRYLQPAKVKHFAGPPKASESK